MKTYRIALCDDFENICNAYAEYINSAPDLSCIWTATDSRACLLKTAEDEPDILLLDIQLGNQESGIDLIPKLKEIAPDMKIVMLTSYDNDEYIYNSLINGADNYLLKSIQPDTFLAELHKILDSFQNVFDKFTTIAREKENSRQSLLYFMNLLIKLTPNEYNIVRDLYFGKSYDTIAKEHYVEKTSIKSTASRIFKKLEVSGKRELLNSIKKTGLFDSGK